MRKANPNPCHKSIFLQLSITIVLCLSSVDALASALISGPTSVCLGTSAQYTVTGASAGTYSWNLPTGATIVSGGSNSTVVTINFSAGMGQFVAFLVNGSTQATISVSVYQPLSGGTLSGATAICAGQTGVQYSLSGLSGVPTGYSWNYEGQGSATITGSTTSSIIVNFPSGITANPVIEAIAMDGPCSVKIFTINLTITSAPSAAGTITGYSTVCAGSSSAYTYSVPAITGATGYVWTVPTGATITSGTNSNSITVTYSSTATNGNVTVHGTNCAGSGASSSFAVTTTSPVGSIGAISGQSAVCEGSTPTYSVTAVANATGYNWTGSGGPITVGSGATNSANISFQSSYPTSGVTISVSGTNICGLGPASTLSVSVYHQPGAAGAITGAATVCPGQNGVAYSVPVIANAANYNWIMPTGAALASGSNTNSITVNFSSSYTGSAGPIVVQGIDGPCGTGAASTLTVPLSPIPSAASTITGTSAVCSDGSTVYTYSVPTITNATGYTWTVPSGATITSGTNTKSITVTYSSSAASGNVTVQGTSCTGNGASSSMAVTVNKVVSITAQPTASTTLCAGSPFSVSVTAGGYAGGGYTYQWMKNGSNMSGATSNIYSIASPQAPDAATYTVKVGGGCGSAVTSGSAVLAVNTPIAITGQPSPAAVCLGNPFSPSVTATGTSPVYQWYKGSAAISGANANIYTIPSVAAADAATYTVKITGTCTATAVTSNNSVLTVNTPIAITGQPSPATVCQGNPFSPSVTATGTSPVYQWYKGSAAISGANASTYTIASVAAGDAATYTVKITGTCTATAATSGNAVLTVNARVAIATQPPPATVCPSSTAPLSVSGITGTGNYTYQWYRTTGTAPTAGWTNSFSVPSGASAYGSPTSNTSSTSNTATVAAGTTGNFFAVVQGACGYAVSGTVAVTDYSAPSISSQPVAPATLCTGSTLSLSVTMSTSGTYKTPYTYQWYSGSSPVGTNSSAYSAAVTNTGTSTVTSGYTVKVTDGCAQSVTSNPASVTVAAPVGALGAINGQPGVCEGSTLTFSVTGDANATSYSWIGSGGPITVGSGATNSANISFQSSYPTSGVTIEVFGVGVCGPGPTSALSVSVYHQPGAAGTITGATTVCQGQSGVAYSVPAITNATVYNWIMPTGATLASGTNTNSITVNFSSSYTGGTGPIIVQGIDGPCGAGTGSTLTVSSISGSQLPAAAGAITGSQNVYPGQTGVTYSVSPVTNASGYQWTLPSGAIITSGSNTNSITVNFPSTFTGGTVSVAGTNSGCAGPAQSEPVAAAGLAGTIGQISGPASVCLASTIDQTVYTYTIPSITNIASNGYVWTFGTGAYPVPGSATNTNTVQVTFSNLQQSTATLSVYGANGYGNSATASITVGMSLQVSATPVISGPETLCQGQSSATYSIPVITNAVNTVWSVPPGVNITSGPTIASGTNSITVAFPTGFTEGVFTVYGTGSGACANSVPASLEVSAISLPPAAGAISGTVACTGSQGVQYSVQQAPPPGTSPVWTVPNGVTIASGQGTNAIAVNYPTTFTSGNISVSYVNSCGSGTPSSLLVTPSGALPVITEQRIPGGVTVGPPYAVGGSFTTLVSAAGQGLTYQWMKNGVAMPGAINSILTINNIQITDQAGYNIVITAPGGCSVSTQPFYIVVTHDADQNYITSRTILADNQFDEAAVIGLPVESQSMSTVYFDGLGRHIQQVDWQHSPLKMDVVQPFVFDALGRESLRYLPYVAQASDGTYKRDVAFGTDNNYTNTTFYNSPFSTVAVDSKPFAQTNFEASPLSRPLQDYGAGQDWYNNSKYVQHGYMTNVDGTEKIIAWKVDNSSGQAVRNTAVSGTSSGQGYYPTGRLYIKSTVDEQGNETRTYTDMSGNVVLKRVYVTGSRTDYITVGNWAETYYIYDDFGLLRYVLQPELSKTAAGSPGYNPTAADLANYAFQYQYDARHRMTVKQVPGSDPVYMVYDNIDRLVLTQDGNQRKDANGNITLTQWTYMKYDAVNRPVVTGIYTHSQVVDQPTMSGLTGTGNETYNGNPPTYGYTNTVFPTSGTSLLTATYYDDYRFVLTLADGGNASVTTYNYQPNDLPGQLAQNSARVTGQVTGTMKNVLGSTTYLWNVNYYDPKYRPLQSISSNYQGGMDRTTNLFDFAGRMLQTFSNHTENSGNHAGIVKTLTYDHASRPLNIYESVNGGGNQQTVQYNYNELGQVVKKNLHLFNDQPGGPTGAVTVGGTTMYQYSGEQSTSTGNLLTGFSMTAGTVQSGGRYAQGIDYRYNIRGWLTSINNSQLSSDSGTTNSDPNDFFGMNLFYEKLDNTGLANAQLYNGNISAVKWSSNLALGTVKDVAYNYSYDPLNRITAASYQSDNAGAWANVTNQYSESGYQYDLNGNIKNLVRNGSTGSPMDKLSYGSYNGNQLLGVSDAGDVSNGFVDGNTSGNDYAYDANGNMVTDKNKGLTANGAVQYNYLNLPSLVTKNTNEKMVYVYDASGVKLEQRVYDASGNLTKTTDYCGSFIYQNGALQFINIDEGRVVMTGTSPEYQYYMKDHLGNTRLLFTTLGTADEPVATYETANYATEYSEFLRYDDARMVNCSLFNHTPGNTPDGTPYSYSQRLSGSTNEKTGLVRSISVMPGDVINMEVYAKYVDPNDQQNTLPLAQLITQIATGAAGITVDGSGYATNGQTPFPYVGMAGEGNSTADAPKAFLNYIMFDRNANPIYDATQTGYVQVTTAAHEEGEGVPHEHLQAQVVVKQAGYMYIFLSNEDESNPVDVFFDDFKVEQVHSPIVQQEDYYPFGLTFNSYTRENAVPQNYLYNGKENISDLSLNWDDYGARMYMPEIGRWGVTDLFCDVENEVSPYNYVRNNPVKYIDPDGHYWVDKNAEKAANKLLISTITKLLDVANKRDVLSGKSDLTKGEKKELKSLERRANQLTKSMGDIIALGADPDHAFDLKNGDNQGAGKQGVQQDADGIINIYGMSDEFHIHEIRHVANNLPGGLRFSKEDHHLITNNNNQGGIYEEISGYYAQFGYSGNGPGTEESVDKLFENLANMRDRNDNIVYPSINQAWLRKKEEDKQKAKLKKP